MLARFCLPDWLKIILNAGSARLLNIGVAMNVESKADSLDMSDEAHIKADRSSIADRKGLVDWDWGGRIRLGDEKLVWLARVHYPMSKDPETSSVFSINKRELSFVLFATGAMLLVMCSGGLTVVSVVPGYEWKRDSFCLVAFGLAIVMFAIAIKLRGPRRRRAVDVCKPSEDAVPLKRFITNPYEPPTSEASPQKLDH